MWFQIKTLSVDKVRLSTNFIVLVLAKISKYHSPNLIEFFSYFLFIFSVLQGSENIYKDIVPITLKIVHLVYMESGQTFIYNSILVTGLEINCMVRDFVSSVALASRILQCYLK